MRGVLLTGTLIALVPLVLVIYYLLQKGLSSLSGSFFTTDPNGNFFGDPGGIRSAILGTIEIVALASLIAVPIKILGDREPHDPLPRTWSHPARTTGRRAPTGSWSTCWRGAIRRHSGAL